MLMFPWQLIYHMLACMQSGATRYITLVFLQHIITYKVCLGPRVANHALHAVHPRPLHILFKCLNVPIRKKDALQNCYIYVTCIM